MIPQGVTFPRQAHSPRPSKAIRPSVRQAPPNAGSASEDTVMRARGAMLRPADQALDADSNRSRSGRSLLMAGKRDYFAGLV